MKNYNNEENFDELTSNGSVYVQFSAAWCGPCKMLTKTIEAIEEGQQDITFLKVNVDENRELAQRFGVRSIPRVILMKDGEQVDEFTGMKSEPELKEILKKL